MNQRVGDFPAGRVVNALHRAPGNATDVTLLVGLGITAPRFRHIL